MKIKNLIMLSKLDAEIFNIMFEVKSQFLDPIIEQYSVTKQDLYDMLWEEFNISGMDTRIANTAFDFLIMCCEEGADLEDTLRKEIKKNILAAGIHYTNIAPDAVNIH